MEKINCPFCNCEIYNSVFIETENFMSIYNISPILPGHSLIIPKKHIISFLDLPKEYLNEFITLGQKTSKVLTDYFQNDSFNLSIQDGIWAGQTVMHLHMHVIPRKQGDLKDPGGWYSELKEKFYDIDSDKRPRLTEDDIKSIVKKLKEFILEKNY